MTDYDDLYNTVCTFAVHNALFSVYKFPYIQSILATHTHRELKMVKSQANSGIWIGSHVTMTVGIPNTQVSPSRGRRITVALKVVLSARSDKMMVEHVVQLRMVLIILTCV